MEQSIIGQKSKQFAIRIIKFSQWLRATKNEHVISKQILRSGTSIGANVRESKNAQSLADFIFKLTIALKEADETCYWLEILYESEIISETEFKLIYADAEELVKILVSTIKTNKSKLKK